MSDDFQQRVLKVLADPTRYRIVQLACEGPQHPKDLARLLGMTTSAVYQHLNALMEVGFIERIEVENRVHYTSRAGVRGFLRGFGEVCETLRDGGIAIELEPLVQSPTSTEGSSPGASIMVQQGVFDRLRSSLQGYYLRSPFWSIVVVTVYVVDVLLAVWCLVYALLYSSNAVLTIVGGLIVCGFLTALANYLYRRTGGPTRRERAVRSQS
jgi:DNA-binding transcriptional ArsR family regulator